MTLYDCNEGRRKTVNIQFSRKKIKKKEIKNLDFDIDV